MWIMRQAGRYLPEYRELKTRYDFLTLVKTPELATEVTLQPLRRFPLDAAIVFSDILIVPEAMGMPYHFREQGGIGMDAAMHSRSQIDLLEDAPEAISERLQYVAQAMQLIRAEIGPDMALLGFAGSPWTLGCFMAQGGSAGVYNALPRLQVTEPQAFASLMQKLTRAVIALCELKIAAGADAIQLFDSLADACPDAVYADASLRWITEIVQVIQPRVPVILYAKCASRRMEQLLATGAKVISVDASVNLRELCDRHPGNYAVQGNLDQHLLETDPEAVRVATRHILREMASRGGHIFNLGHGITPKAHIACVEALMQEVTEFCHEH